MSIVVIIPYYNESSTIEVTLDSLKNQTLTPDSVLLVDSGSTDNTSNIINNWIKNYNMKYFKNIFSGRMSPSSSINYGIKKSDEDIIAYIDCGLDIPYKWIESSLDIMKNQNADVVSSKIYTAGIDMIDKSFIAQTYGFEKKSLCLPGSLIKRNVFSQIGLLLENVRASYDTDFVNKLHLNNFKRTINEAITIKYLGFNYTNSLISGAEKVYLYSQDGWYAKGDNKPIIYLVLTISIAFLFLFSFETFIFFVITYIILRSLIIPISKSKKSLKLIKSKNFFYLPISGFIIDSARSIGYIKAFFSNLRKS